MKFIHFGCWNKGECNKETNLNPLSIVMSDLNKKVKEVEFIIVAGDNYYKEKKEETEKKKATPIDENETANLKSGFECLPKTVPVYILYGNHDVINKTDVGCSILTSQITFVEKFLLEKSNLILFEDVNIKQIDKNTTIIMFDSSLYTLPDQANEPSLSLCTFINKSCYNKLFQQFKEKETKNLQDLCTYQTNKIVAEFSKNQNNQNIIFVAHHPLVCTKPTKNNCYAENLIKLFKDNIGPVYETIKGTKPKIYYLCADYHVYQKMDINIQLDPHTVLPITQYTVGTGGADLDDISIMGQLEKDETLLPIYNTHVYTLEETFGLTYKVNDEKKSHGFLEVTVTETVSDTETVSNIIFEFISVASQKEKTLVQRKYLKYKMKYLNLKLGLHNMKFEVISSGKS